MKLFSLLMLTMLLVTVSCSKKEVAVNPMEGLAPAELLTEGNKAYMEGNMEKAIQAYEIIYTRYPTSREYISAVLGMARSYNNLGDFEEGFRLLYNLIRENMVPSRVPEIYNEMAKYYEVTAVYSKEAGISREEEDYRKAISFYRKAVDYPNSDDMNSKSYAQFQIAELELKLENPEDAALAYQQTIRNFSGTEWAQLAEQRLKDLRQGGQTRLSPLPEKSQETYAQPEAVSADSTAAP